MAVQAWLRAYIQQLSNAVAVWMTPSSLRLSGSARVAARLCPAAERGPSVWMTPSSLRLCGSAGVAAHVSMRAWLSAYVQQLSEVSRCG